MKFYNHCTTELSKEAERIINAKSWHIRYKKQLLVNVINMLESGYMVTTSSGGYSVPFGIGDVENIVNNISERD